MNMKIGFVRRFFQSHKVGPNDIRTLILVLLSIVILIFLILNAAREKDNQRLSYTEQMLMLTKTQQSLISLNEFIDLQKKKLKESQDLINALQSEQEKIKPVVEANRQTVDAILNAQFEKNRLDVWRERLMGFVLGVFSSILSSVIVTYVKRLLSRKKPPPDVPIPATH